MGASIVGVGVSSAVGADVGSAVASGVLSGSGVAFGAQAVKVNTTAKASRRKVNPRCNLLFFKAQVSCTINVELTDGGLPIKTISLFKVE